MIPLVDLFRITETLPEPWFATAKSGLPSPSKSPMATEIGTLPVVKIYFSVKVDASAGGLITDYRNSFFIKICYCQIGACHPHPNRQWLLKKEQNPWQNLL
jgi:hypothetical protein